MKKVGIYNPYLETRGGGEKLCLTFAEVLSKLPDHEVHLITHGEIDLSVLSDYFQLDLSHVYVQIVEMDKGWINFVHKLPLPGALKNIFNDKKVYQDIKHADYDLFVNNCYHSNLPGPGKVNTYMCMFPQKIDVKYDINNPLKKVYKSAMRWLYRFVMHSSKKSGVLTYDNVLSISEYTKEYVKKYWDRDSEILFPICEDMSVSTYKKQKKIVSVGRFFENVGENHHKRHDFLLESFKKMKKLHDDGWELHFVGSVAEDIGALKYILDLMSSASGYPVYFHFNAPFKELKKAYNEASIYWHATGYKSDPNKHPEKQEHFGITTIEAMSTGAIPVVINTAGQKELVTDGKDGFLWGSQEELIKKTEKVANMSDSEREKFAQAAIESSKNYNKQAFTERVKTILDQTDF